MHIPFENTIQLSEMDQVKLMNRVDTKYWFHIDTLPEVFEKIKQHYLILHINEKCVLPYSTVYYDTSQNSMYISHHNGKLNRFKVRVRTYVTSGIQFLEIKKKNNKGRTIKSRINSAIDQLQFDEAEKSFVDKNCPYTCDELKPMLRNEFDRITLVNKDFNERCTIDLNLQFNTRDNSARLDKLVIVEIKSDGHSANSPLTKVLNEFGIKKSGFSKYCIGRVLTDPQIKSNAFKPNIRRIEKTIFSVNHNQKQAI